MDANQNYIIRLLLFACVLVYLVGAIRVPLMEIDAAQYANISREMLANHHYLQVFDRGQDYLDKPPMLFWLSALSMHLLGIHDFAYRLPSLFFALIAIYSTYRFSLLYYTKQIALLSALVLASCQALFLITHDVRTDTLLMGWVILSIWQLAKWLKHGGWGSFVLASIAIAGGMMTKGPIALMVPVFAFAPQFLLQRAYKNFFRWEYLLLLLIIAVLLLPMDLGLYWQFDLHPEKTAYGLHAVSGLRFFYWTQSFGRITGESSWHENASFFFLLQNMLWSFLPWIIFFLIGLGSDISSIIRKKFRLQENEEWISAAGFVLTYSALGISHYQLPHYIFVVFPLAAVVTGKFLYSLLYTNEWKGWRKPLSLFHNILYLLLFFALLGLLYWPFRQTSVWTLFAAFVCLILLIILLIKPIAHFPLLLLTSCYTIIIVNFFLDSSVYPHLLMYQQSIAVARVIQSEHLAKNDFYIYHTEQERSLQFYTNTSYINLEHIDSLPKSSFVLTSAKEWETMKKENFRIIYRGEGFHVSTLSLNFLNPSDRKEEVQIFYILQRK